MQHGNIDVCSVDALDLGWTLGMENAGPQGRQRRRARVSPSSVGQLYRPRFVLGAEGVREHCLYLKINKPKMTCGASSNSPSPLMSRRELTPTPSCSVARHTQVEMPDMGNSHRLRVRAAQLAARLSCKQQALLRLSQACLSPSSSRCPHLLRVAPHKFSKNSITYCRPPRS